MDPRYSQAYRNRGDLWFNQGNLVAALADYQKVVELDGRLGPMNVDRGFHLPVQSMAGTGKDDSHQVLRTQDQITFVEKRIEDIKRELASGKK